MERSTHVPARPAPWWRTVLWGTLCAAMSMSSMAISELGASGEGSAALLILVAALVSVTLPLLLLWRRRAPYAVTLAASAVAVVLPVGTWTALVALGSLVARRRGRDVWWTTAAVALATTVTVVRDARGRTTASSFIKTLLAPTGAEPGAEVTLGWWVAPLFIALGVTVAVGAGLAVRARREAALSAGQVTAAAKRTERLDDQLARQRERERIGREVHDVLGHRLSLLNLHAGALEAHAPPDGQLRESARLVREGAAKSMADLRSLLTMLNEPLGTEPAEPDLSLVDLPAMISETVDAGLPVSSSVYIDGAERADPALARAVYRIVQELLTNARRHAEGRPVRLDVTGSPAAGMHIDARNPYVPSERPGTGQGLRGIAERVELLGGELAYGLDDGGRTFRVTVRLPWREAGV